MARGKKKGMRGIEEMSTDGSRQMPSLSLLFLLSLSLSTPQTTHLLVVLRISGYGRDVRVVAKQLSDERARGGGGRGRVSVH